MTLAWLGQGASDEAENDAIHAYEVLYRNSPSLPPSRTVSGAPAAPVRGGRDHKRALLPSFPKRPAPSRLPRTVTRLAALLFLVDLAFLIWLWHPAR